MDTYQEKTITVLLDAMASQALNRCNSPAGTVAGLQYLIWEARKLLNLPDIDELYPFSDASTRTAER